MSTRHITITDSKDPAYKLGFETGLNGCKLVFEKEGTEEIMKFWIDEASWESLAETVEAHTRILGWGI